MTDAEWMLLLAMRESQDHGAFAMACDGPDRKGAHAIEKLGYAEWKGTNWGSSFWAINDKGREAIAQR